MARQPVHNVVEERTSGYITRKKLETFLQARYPHVSSVVDFDIRVRLSLTIECMSSWLSDSGEA
jgi:hypothetical protein